METVELRKIWKTLVEENLIDKNLAKEKILEIITKKGNGVISKILRKHQLDFKVYLAAVIFIPLLMLFVAYHDSLNPGNKTISELGRQYTILLLFEAFMIYALMSVKRNMNFIKNTYNTGTLKESLLNVKSYFQSITKRGFWTGTISMMAIFIFIELDTLLRIGGISNMNFSFSGPNIYESYFSIFLMILIISTPFIIKANTKKYAGVLNDLNQTIEELNEEA